MFGGSKTLVDYANVLQLIRFMINNNSLFLLSDYFETLHILFFGKSYAFAWRKTDIVFKYVNITFRRSFAPSTVE